ncbi:cation:proton antiporter [Anaplasmataceae bacterium AB001_6]|nr:cation:proton antiporter [Anaplasmataceae bacterium AB001_6]
MSRFFALFAVAISSSIGVALSGNLWTLFIFYELLTVCTYPLVTFDRKAVHLKSGKTYINVLMGTSMALLMPAVIIIWQFNGADSLIFGKDMKVVIPNILMQLTLFLMILYGCSKSALFPFSSWLPKAMTAPTPVSALLHAVAVVKAGVFSIMKITYYAFDMHKEELQITLMAITIITIIFASMEAVHKKQIKSILAYSTIGQLSYILMIFACFGEKGLAVALLYMILHSMAKITLFFTAGAIYIKTGYKYVGEMKGLANRMPTTCVIFSIAAFGIIGIPPTATIWAKYMMFSVAQSKIILMALTIGFSTLMSVLYFFPIIHNFFFGISKIKYDKNEPPALMLFSYGCTCAILVIMYFYPALTAKFIDFVINNQDIYK